jgi:hypothetical protein
LGALLLLALAVFLPAAADMRRLAAPPPAALACSGLAALLALSGLELRKAWLARRSSP